MAEPLGVSLVQLVGFTTWEGAAYPWSIGSASFYAAVWPGIFDADVGIEGFDADAAAVVALFLSAPGWPYPRWKKVGNAPMPPDLPFPAYRSTTPDGPIVVDFTYVHRRSVQQADVRHLRPATWGTSGLLEDLIAVVNGLKDDDLKSLEHWSIVAPPNRTAAWFPDHPGLQHRPRHSGGDHTASHPPTESRQI